MEPCRHVTSQSRGQHQVTTDLRKKQSLSYLAFAVLTCWSPENRADRKATCSLFCTQLYDNTHPSWECRYVPSYLPYWTGTASELPRRTPCPDHSGHVRNHSLSVTSVKMNEQMNVRERSHVAHSTPEGSGWRAKLGSSHGGGSATVLPGCCGCSWFLAFSTCSASEEPSVRGLNRTAWVWWCQPLQWLIYMANVPLPKLRWFDLNILSKRSS